MWFKKNWLAIVGNILIWGVPIGLLLYYILTSESETMTTHRWEGWVSVALIAVLLVYFKAFKKRIAEGRLASKIRKGFVTVFYRLLELGVYIISLVAVGLLINTMLSMGQALLDFVIIVGVSGVVGYVFLLIDSSKRAEEAEQEE